LHLRLEFTIVENKKTHFYFAHTTKNAYLSESIFYDEKRPNGLRYSLVGGLGKCLRAGKTRSQKNACRSRRIPTIHCTLCSAAIFHRYIHQ